tara:strand:- start:119 stop:577 length:459 start_codon:yes stop_codon:yes gene_type:complete
MLLPISTTVPPEWVEALDQRARLMGCSRAIIIRDLVGIALGRDEIVEVGEPRTFKSWADRIADPAYRVHVKSVAQFAKEQLIVGGMSAGGDLYRAYVSYCQDIGDTQVAGRNFFYAVLRHQAPVRVVRRSSGLRFNLHVRSDDPPPVLQSEE